MQTQPQTQGFAPAAPVSFENGEAPEIIWSAGKFKMKVGSRTSSYYKATPSPAFWSFYENNRTLVRASGITLHKEQGFVLLAKRKVSLVHAVRSIDMSRSVGSDVEILGPKDAAYLPYQRAGIEYARYHRNVLFGDEMGLGKTIQAIGVCNDDPTIKSVLVIVPAYLKLNWKREIERWYVRSTFQVAIVNAGDPWPSCAPSVGCFFTIINYDIIQRYGKDIGLLWDAVITDECHYIKNPKTKRTTAVLAIKSRRWLALSGTPALNRPIELWPVLSIMLSEDCPSWYSFAIRYCGGTDNGFGFEAKGSTNEAELQMMLRSRCMVRRLKDEVLTDLPPKIRQTIVLPPDNKARMVLNEEAQAWKLHEDTIADLTERRANAMISEDEAEYVNAGKAIARQMSIAFAEMALLRVNLSKLKVPFLCEHVESLISGGVEKVLVFFHHKEALRLFADEMRERGVLIVTGDIPAEKRDPIVTEFKTNPAKMILAGTIGAMGTGFNITNASNVVFAELDWRPGIMCQAEDRTHRIGQLNSVLCQYLLFDDSLDLHMIGNIIAKMESISKVLNKVVEEEPEQVAGVERKPAPKKRLTPVGLELRPVVLRGIQYLASKDQDLARTRNNEGFSKFDVRIGHRLASKPFLTANEAAYGASVLLRKYRRQLPREIIRALWPEEIDRDGECY